MHAAGAREHDRDQGMLPLGEQLALRLSTVAIHRASASLAASEGWKVKGPTSIQFWLPQRAASDREHQPQQDEGEDDGGPGDALEPDHVDAGSSRNMQNTPIAANMPCFRAAEYGDSPAAMASTLEAESTIMMPIAVRARVEPRIR